MEVQKTGNLKTDSKGLYINVEPEWERVWRWFKHVEFTDLPTFKRMTERDADAVEDWRRLEAMAIEQCWEMPTDEAQDIF